MPFKKGEPRPKNAGRKKGTPNKKTQDVTDKLEAMGCDPIEGMAKIAEKAFEDADYQLAGNMYKELAQYVAPKRKAIEVTGEGGGPLVLGWQS